MSIVLPKPLRNERGGGGREEMGCDQDFFLLGCTHTHTHTHTHTNTHTHTHKHVSWVCMGVRVSTRGDKEEGKTAPGGHRSIPVYVSQHFDVSKHLYVSFIDVNVRSRCSVCLSHGDSASRSLVPTAFFDTMRHGVPGHHTGKMRSASARRRLRRDCRARGSCCSVYELRFLRAAALMRTVGDCTCHGRCTPAAHD
jgi:hypothetical protein